MRNLGNTLTRHFYSANFGRVSRTANNGTVAILKNVMDELSYNPTNGREEPCPELLFLL